jgi:glycosyltransferase involved in cell wall biosynthesis
MLAQVATNSHTTLTVIVPVYQEAKTVEEAIGGVLGLQLPNVNIDIVIVESNSTDGTREKVVRLAEDPRVTLVLQTSACGKGNAVREGLRHATGEIVLIQDADLEYDVADYPKLLQPIIAGSVDFVLGSRHDANKPMRVMDDARFVDGVMNFGHYMFTLLFNIIYGTKLKDPFTMYKVFRRRCIDGVTFECDRFDFDWEIVGKLVRLGYVPVEVPVSYKSRGFEEGKKVRLVRDPLTWLRAAVKFRIQPLSRFSSSGRGTPRGL